MIIAVQNYGKRNKKGDIRMNHLSCFVSVWCYEKNAVGFLLYDGFVSNKEATSIENDMLDLAIFFEGLLIFILHHWHVAAALEDLVM